MVKYGGMMAFLCGKLPEYGGIIRRYDICQPGVHEHSVKLALLCLEEGFSVCFYNGLIPFYHAP